MSPAYQITALAGPPSPLGGGARACCRPGVAGRGAAGEAGRGRQGQGTHLDDTMQIALDNSHAIAHNHCTPTGSAERRNSGDSNMPGYVFYDGPSLIDGSPIIGIAVTSESRNAKTGNMVQTYIIRADMPPMEAIRIGADDAICGDCQHRGKTCYVDVGKSVTAVFYAWMRGSYELASPKRVARMLRGRKVRIGAYGDPAAIPAMHWRDLVRHAIGHTGYSHQWRQAFAQGLRGIVMASADSPAERDVARAMGWRTFRVRTAGQPLAAREIMCPASDEAGKRRQCASCMACDGAARGAGQASVAIIVHGAKAKRFIPIVAA